MAVFCWFALTSRFERCYGVLHDVFLPGGDWSWDVDCSVDSLKDMGSEMSLIALPSHYLVFVGNSTCSVSGALIGFATEVAGKPALFLVQSSRGLWNVAHAGHITATFDELCMNLFPTRLPTARACYQIGLGLPVTCATVLPMYHKSDLLNA